MQAEIFTNHEVADTLDSSEAFEGPEKTLRIYFNSVGLCGDAQGLLKIPHKEWEKTLELVKCKILSVLVHPKIHAYVLSESSLFVHPQHVILKTCGTTTLLDGVASIIQTVAQFEQETLVKPTVTCAFYSRRSYFSPEKQCHPHGCWDAEVSSLKKIFQKPAFASCFGSTREERWHLFSHAKSPEDSTCAQPAADGWVELMMTGLDNDLASRFHLKSSSLTDRSSQGLEDSVLSLDSMVSTASAVGAEPDDDDPGHSNGNVMTRSSEIDQLFVSEKQCIDSFAFTPCGYSCNGVMLETGEYFTIHVTPERGYSYASFETNVRRPSLIENNLTHQGLLERVIRLFEPQKLTLVICLPSKEKLIEHETLYDGKYRCTCEAEFDVSNASVVQLSLEKLL